MYTSVVKNTSKVIWDNLQKGKFVDAPTHHESCLHIVNEFDKKGNFPHCVGPIDGKHVIIQAPTPCGSEYFNYKKKTHSIVQLAVCNASYEFILVDVNDNGRHSDGGVYTNSTIGYTIDKNLLDLPTPGIIRKLNETYL